MSEGLRGRQSRLFVYLTICVCALPVETAAAEFSSVYGTDHSLFENLTSPYFNFLDGLFYYLSEAGENISENCRRETSRLLNQARSGNEEALKIFDSIGKPSSGILEGDVYSIGYYSECLNVAIKTDGNVLQGKYCLINLNAAAVSQQKVLPQASWIVLSQAEKPPTIGICVPHVCSDEDILNASSSSVYDNFKDVNVKVTRCHTDLPGFSKDAGAIVTFCILLIFLGTALVATVFDFILGREEKEALHELSKTISTTELCQEENAATKGPSTSMRCLLSFSLKTNAGKIFSVGSGDNIQALHGLKFLSMALIILGHTFSFATQNLFIRNPGAADQTPKDFLAQFFANGTLAVDTFYLISGILVCYVTLKAMDKMKGKLPLLYFYLHRYFRLTPLMLAVILFCAFMLRYMSSGPNWLSTIEMYDVWCKRNGWINAFYLHNFINTDNMCLPHSWYLATDMQMYIVSPLILIPLYRNLKFGIISLSCFLLATVVTTATITAINHYPAIPYINHIVPVDVVNEYYQYVYIKPYCRIGPYIVGMSVGYYILQTKELILKKRTAALCWIISVALGLSVVYLMWPANQGRLPSNAEAAAYSSLARTVWAISLGWLMIACVYGYGGFINSILTWPPFIPLSRLTYCAYLIHPVVMNVYYGSMETEVFFSTGYMLYMFLGNLCITYLLSTFLSLIFESPFVGLEKVLLSTKSA